MPTSHQNDVEKATAPGVSTCDNKKIKDEERNALASSGVLFACLFVIFIHLLK